jgi:LysR family glycine cleavage system transcriptional activator
MSRLIPSLSGLESFEATARLGSVTRAAAELNLTQSAVSRHIIVLEKRLGVALFIRKAQRLELSEAGAAYLAEVRGSLASLQTATTSLMASRGRTGSLSIATLPTFGANWLVPRLPRFRARHPGISLQLVGRPEPFDFAFDRVDCAIHFGNANWPGAAAEFLCTETLAVVAPPAVAARIDSPEALLRETLLRVSSRPFAWRDWASFAGVPDLAVKPQVTVDTFAMALAAVRAELAVAVLPTFLVESDLNAGTLALVLNGGSPSQSNYYFVRPQGRGIPYSVRKFGEWLQSEVSGSALAESPLATV